MKDLFSWRIRPSEEEFSSLWDNATFIFDTNFLLDLYRVSRSTAEDFLKVLEQIKDRVWLPYQVADEFFRHREEVIIKEAKSFENALKILEEWKSEQQQFNSLRGKLKQAGRIVGAEVEFLFNEQNKYIDEVNIVEIAFREKIEELASDHALNPDKDSILEKLLIFFDSKVGQPSNEQELQKIYKEGEVRYSQSKPPGFKDNKKEGISKYGDFILWKAILDFAKKDSRPIIFITGEKKEDWWSKRNGEIVSPLAELRLEFQEYVRQPFWMYRSQRFLELAREKFNIDIDSSSIKEMGAISEISDTEDIDDNYDENLIEISNSEIQDLYQLESLSQQYQQAHKLIVKSATDYLQLIDHIKTPDSSFQKALKSLQQLTTSESPFHRAVNDSLKLASSMKSSLARIAMPTSSLSQLTSNTSPLQQFFKQNERHNFGISRVVNDSSKFESSMKSSLARIAMPTSSFSQLTSNTSPLQQVFKQNERNIFGIVRSC